MNVIEVCGDQLVDKTVSFLFDLTDVDNDDLKESKSYKEFISLLVGLKEKEWSCASFG